MNQRSWRARENNIENSSQLDPRLIWSSSNIEKSAVFEPRLIWVPSDKSAIEEYPQGKDFYDHYSQVGGGDGVVNVFKAVCRPFNSCLVAIKIIDIQRSKTYFDYVFARAKIMPHLNHPNIVRTHCVFVATECLWVVTPYIPGGSFQSIVAASYQDGLMEHIIAAILSQVLKALKYLHGEGYCHGNVKPGNILIDIDGTVLLADFLSEAVNHDCDPTNNEDGTPAYWIAPELKNRALSPAADMWQFGITALELIHGSRVPVSQRPTLKSLLEKISRRFRYTERYERGENSIEGRYMSQAFKDMVGWCLRQDPSDRPTPEDLLMHPFFKNCHIPEYLVDNLLEYLLDDVEGRFIKAEADRRRKIASEREAKSTVVEDLFQKKIIGWKLNREEGELDPVFEGETTISGKNIDKNVGVNGTVSLGKNIDENVGVNGTVSLGKNIDENVGTSGTVSSGKNIGKNFGTNGTISLGKDIDEPVIIDGIVTLRRKIDANVSTNDTVSPGENIDENVGTNGTAPLGKKNDENVGTNGTAPLGKKNDENVGTNGTGKNTDVNVVNGLAFLEKSLDGQKEMLRGVKEMMASYVGQESAWKKREEQLMEHIEELRAEVENEKKIMSGLGVELKFLKSQNPNAAASS